jgi:hypothetical protein
MKTGECYERDEEGKLWLCESFIDENNYTYSTKTLIEEK